VFIGAIDDHACRVYNAARGDLLWTFPANGGVSQPALAAGTVFVQSNFFQIYAMDPATGDPRWTGTYLGSGGAGSPAVAGTWL
jgi:outer membrane protein assembly factor BamB